MEKLRHLLWTRFIVISEILGYAMSGAVFIGVLCSLFIQVELVSKAGGTIHPLYEEVVTDSDALVIEYLVNSGESVVTGQPLIRVAIDEPTQHHVMVRRLLTATAALLEANVTADSDTALKNVRDALLALPLPAEGQIISATSDGLMKQTVEPAELSLVPQGTPLAIVFNPSVLVLEGTLGTSNTDGRVVEGQLARVTVSIEFENLSPQVQEHFSDSLSDNVHVVSQDVATDIVVGHQSLFKQMFGRN